MNSEKERQEQIDKVLYMRVHPDVFIEQVMGEESLEEFQRRVCKLFAKYDRLNVKACHAVGKTWLLARLGLAFLYLYEGAKVITTAPTHRQVVTLLWGELRKAKKKSRVYLDGKLLNNQLTIADDWFAIGFSPNKGAESDTKEQQGSSFQGFHAPYILIIFDEATGITRDMYAMAEGLMTSGVVVKWVCIANPTTRACEFHKNTKQAEWYTHTINCFDSPNMIANGFTNRPKLEAEIDHLRTLTDEERLERIKNYAKPNPHLLNAQWAVAKLYQWGFNHPLSKSKILGEFPDNEDNVIIPYENLQMAFNRELPEVKTDVRYIGVDAARFGEDLSVLTEIQGWRYIDKAVHGKLRTTELTGHVIAFFRKRDIGIETHIVVDATGVGAGTCDELIEAKRTGVLPRHCHIHEVHFAQSIEPTDDSEGAKEETQELRKTYENLKAHMFAKLSEDLRDNIALPEEEVFEEELPALLFTYSKKGKLIVEDKEQFKSRYGKSPDHADSLALANYARYLKPAFDSFLPIAQAAKHTPKPMSKRDAKGKATEGRIRVKDQ